MCSVHGVAKFAIWHVCLMLQMLRTREKAGPGATKRQGGKGGMARWEVEGCISPNRQLGLIADHPVIFFFSATSCQHFELSCVSWTRGFTVGSCNMAAQE